MRPLLSVAVFAALLGTALPASAQYIDPSPRGSWEQDVSGTAISVDYSRPSVRDRVTFGSQVAFGEFWTPGANLVTKLRFSKDVTLQGNEVAAGAYGLWMEASEDSDTWRAMLTADTTLFHAPHLTEDDGFLVFEVPHEIVAVHQETLLLQLDSIRTGGAQLRMHWGTDRVSIDIGIDHGIVFTVTEEQAAMYAGSWTRKMAPWSDERIAEARADWEEAEREGFDEWYEGLISRESEMELVLNEDGYLTYDLGAPPEMNVVGALFPRGEGFFISGFLWGGDPTAFDPVEADLIEFLFEDGVATSAEERNGDGDLTYTMRRNEG